MPAGISKKSKTAESVPSVGDPDRKRVLNVLAQRRYRQRRSEKLAALQAQVQPVQATESADQIHGIPVALELESADDSHLTLPTEDVEPIEEIPRTPPTDPLSLFDFDPDPFSFPLSPDIQAYGSLPTPLPSTSPSPTSHISPLPLSLDATSLPIPILASLHAFSRIATALNLTPHIWNPTYLHILTPCLPSFTTLPANLHPTPAQLTIPHHPVLDILPWPSVREKLICMLSLPSAFRSPVAQEPNHEQVQEQNESEGLEGVCDGQGSAIVQLVQDLDDLRDGGGVRVHGNMTTWEQGNELVEEAWEVGDVFYAKWWWCLDQRVVEVSNRRRRERGLGKLGVVMGC